MSTRDVELSGAATPLHSRLRENVGDAERLGTAFAGGALVVSGLALGIYRRSILGYALAALGAGLSARSVTGYCPVYAALGTNRRTGPVKPVMIEESIVVARSTADVYAFWRDLRNLPRVLRHVEDVRPFDAELSRWTAKLGGKRFEWDARIVTDQPGELIGWRSIEGADVDNAGSVRFIPLDGGRATELKVTLTYLPGPGLAGKAAGLLARKITARQVAKDLLDFKRTLEGDIVPASDTVPGTGPVVWQ